MLLKFWYFHRTFRPEFYTAFLLNSNKITSFAFIKINFVQANIYEALQNLKIQGILLGNITIFVNFRKKIFGKQSHHLHQFTARSTSLQLLTRAKVCMKYFQAKAFNSFNFYLIFQISTMTTKHDPESVFKSLDSRSRNSNNATLIIKISKSKTKKKTLRTELGFVCPHH
jgi:hypothetical protein